MERALLNKFHTVQKHHTNDDNKDLLSTQMHIDDLKYLVEVRNQTRSFNLSHIKF